MALSDEWYTPKNTLEQAKEFLGEISLDPASCEEANELVGAESFFTKEDDGLTKEWFGKVWCNPPYSRTLIGKFTAKFAAAEFDEGLMLVNAVTDTKWALKLRHLAVVYSIGRLPFWSPLNQSYGKGTKGSALYYVGDRPQEFVDFFESTGEWYAPNKLLNGSISITG